MFITSSFEISPGIEDRFDAARSREVTRRAARSFYVASYVLRADMRAAAYAVYAFCRVADDAVDRAPSPAAARRALAGMRDELDRVYQGVSTTFPALSETVRAYDIPKIHFVDLLRGIAMDLDKKRYTTFDELREYCFCVASTVGLIMSHIFGATDPEALQRAEDLGIAMQLTNIIRDVGEDWGMGRFYLPECERAAAQVTVMEIAQGERSDRLVAFLRGQIARAREFYARGESGIAMIPDASARACVRLMSTIYADILHQIERNQYDVFSRRAVVPTHRKLALAVRAAARRRERVPLATPPKRAASVPMQELLNGGVRDAVASVVPPALREVVEYSVQGGKRARGIVTMLACAAAGGRADDALDAAVAIELLHAASLVHDDIMDNAFLRRGQPALHVNAGVSAAILSGDTMIALAFKVLRRGASAHTIDRFTDAFLRVCEGQGYDISLTTDKTDTATHRTMVELKTASLLETACAMGASIASHSPAVIDILARYGRALGMAFQAKDDLLDLEGTPEETGKSTGIDAHNGRATFVAAGTHDQVHIAREAVRSYTRSALDALAALPDSAAREELETLARSLAVRTA